MLSNRSALALMLIAVAASAFAADGYPLVDPALFT